MLAAFCAQLLQQHRDHLDQLLILLPTQRLATQLRALLTSAGSRRVFPRLYTLDTFVTEHFAAEVLRGSPLLQDAADLAGFRELTDEVNRLILSALLNEQNSFVHLHGGHEAEIYHLFAEIDEYELGEEAFRRLESLTGEEAAHRDRQDSSYGQRFRELADLYGQYKQCLRAGGFIGRQQALARKCQALSSLWEQEAGSLAGNILYCGFFTSLKAYYRPLFQVLKGSRNLRFFLSPVPPELMTPGNPLHHLYEVLQLPRLAAPSTEVLASLSIHSFSSPLEEVAFVLAEVQRLTLPRHLGGSHGLLPAELGIIVPNERAYAKILRAFVDIAGCKANLALAIPLRETPLARQLLRRLRSELVLGWAEVGQQSQALDFWLKHYEGVLAALLGEGEEKQADDGAGKALRGVGDDLKLFSAIRPSFLSAGAFLALLTERLSSGRCYRLGYPLEGVQVLSLAESRYIPFRQVFLLGCLEGDFPRSLPPGYLLEQRYKKKLGLPTWAYFEALEDTSFYLLHSNCRQLLLTYPRSRGGRGTVRSRFIEQRERLRDTIVCAHGASSFTRSLFAACPLPAELGSLRRNYAEREAGIQPLPAQQHQGLYQGERREFFASISPTDLEKLLHCPYQFLLKRLQLVPRLKDEVKEELDQRQEGELLHRIVEEFFVGSNFPGEWGRVPGLSPRDILETPSAHLLKRLNLITATVLPPAQRHSPFYYNLSEHAWPRFIAYLKERYQQLVATGRGLPQTTLNEWRLGTEPFAVSPQLRFNLGGEDFVTTIVGTIDRLEVGAGYYQVTDYKRRSLPFPAEIMTADVPQLIVYALALAQVVAAPPSNEISFEGGELRYWSLLEGKASAPCKNLAKAAERLHERWQARLQQLLPPQSAAFVAEPGRACTFCSYAGLCRKGMVC